MSLRRGTPGAWIAGLVAALVVLNALGLGLYVLAHPHEAGWLRVWTYLGSDLSKLISTSLILPLLIFVLEAKFHVRDTIRAARVDRRRQAQDARRAARAAAIEDTAASVTSLVELANEVALWDGASDLVDVQRRTAPAILATEGAVNRWQLFPNLIDTGPPRACPLEGYFLGLANLLLQVTFSAIGHLRSTTDADARQEVMDAVGVFAEAIDACLHHPLLNVLNASLELLEIEESDDVDELRLIETDAQAAARRSGYEQAVAGVLESMRQSQEFFDERRRRLPLLAGAEGPEADAVRAAGAAATFAQWDAVPRRERLRWRRIRLSREWILETSDELAYVAFTTSEAAARTSPAGRPPAAVPPRPAASGA